MLRSTVSRSGGLVPVAIPHLVGRGGLDETTVAALQQSLHRSFDEHFFGKGDYHSRLRGLEYWLDVPSQLERLYHAFRQGSRPRPKRFSYKEPFFALCPEFITEALPEAKIIYILRDGRDVANSLVESYGVLTDEELTHLRSTEMRLGRTYDERYVPWWVKEGREKEFIESSPYVRSIWMWAYMTQRCHEHFLSLNTPDQVLQIRYERFMRTPYSTGEKILEHLGVKETKAFRRRLGKARTSSIGKHKKRPEGEIDAAHHVASPVLETLGMR
jgi:hypothetical protein